jgi:hypothetical protein
MRKKIRDGLTGSDPQAKTPRQVRQKAIVLLSKQKSARKKFRGFAIYCRRSADSGTSVAAELLARPVMDFRDLRHQILIANQPSRTAAGFRSRSVPA